MEIRGKVIAKAGNGKAFKLGEDWYNVLPSVIPNLEKISKGDEINVTYEKKGTVRTVSEITTGQARPQQQAQPEQETSAGYSCTVCGKALKDDKFKKCFMCNKAGKESGTQTKAPKAEQAPTGFNCEDCGKVLKDGKYAKCFSCNKKSPKQESEEPKAKSTFTSYSNPEKDAQIRKGNSLNAAAAVLAGADCIRTADPETIAEITKVVAISLLSYLEN